MRCKKLFAVLTLLCFMLTLLPAPVFAATTVASGRCGDTATWTLDSDGVLTISGSGEIKDSPWQGRYANTTIKKVIVEKGITDIGYAVFRNCDALTEVVLSEGLETIGIDAFAHCDNLKIVRFPKNLKKLGTVLLNVVSA